MTDHYPIEKYPVVICPQCRGQYYRVNDKFDPNKFCCGEMLTLLPQWQSAGWPTFTPDAIVQRLKCPQCHHMLSTYEGKVELTFEPPAPPPAPPEPLPYEDAPPMYLQEPPEREQEQPEPEKEQPKPKVKTFKRVINA